jgi:hypothetical protein
MMQEKRTGRGQDRGSTGQRGSQQGGGTPPKAGKPRTIEVPGRPDAEHEPRRDKAYGPGGAEPENVRASSRRDATPIDEPTSNIDDPPLPGEPPGGGRTAEGADTKPL